MDRHSIAPGGVPRYSFHRAVTGAMLIGNALGEDTTAMLDAHPLMNEYWQGKIARLDRVDVPAYVVSSYTNKVHTRGTIHAFNGIASTQKWLRIHNSHEWPDFYEQDADLAKFFDRYLRDIDNGWEQTPRVRMSVLDPGGTDTVGRAEEAFPPASAVSRALQLDASTMTLRLTDPQSAAAQPAASQLLVLGDGRSRLSFTHQFTHDTEIAGFPLLRLCVEPMP